MTAIGLLNPPSGSALPGARTAPGRVMPRADFADLLAERSLPPEPASRETSTADDAESRQQDAEASDQQPAEQSSRSASETSADDGSGPADPPVVQDSGKGATSEPIVTIRDVAKELVHAATIDLAAISKQEMSQPKAAKHPGPPDATLTRPPRHEPLTASSGAQTNRTDQAAVTSAPDTGQQQAISASRQAVRPDAAREVPSEQSHTPGSDPNQIQRLAANGPHATSKQAEAPVPTLTARADLLTRLTGSAEAARGAISAVDRAALQPGARQADSPGLPARPADTLGRTNRDAILQTVQRGLASVLSQGGGRMTVVLRPEHLGEVRVQLDARRGVVNARLTAETEAARRTLESGTDQLRASLESRGIRVESIRVDGPQSEEQASDTGRTEADARGRSDDRRGSDDRGSDRARDDRSGSDERSADPETQTRTGIWTDIGIDTVV